MCSDMPVCTIQSNNIINSELAEIAIFSVPKAIIENNTIDTTSFCITLNSVSLPWAGGSPIAPISDLHNYNTLQNWTLGDVYWSTMDPSQVPEPIMPSVIGE